MTAVISRCSTPAPTVLSTPIFLPTIPIYFLYFLIPIYLRLHAKPFDLLAAESCLHICVKKIVAQRLAAEVSRLSEKTI